MPTKWERAIDSFQRAHDDFEFDLCDFYVYGTTYTPSTGEQSISQTSTHTANAELVKPSNSNVDLEAYGTESNIDIVVRLKKSETFISNLDFMGDGSEYPSQVETPSDKRFKLIDSIYEQMSGFVTIPATESGAPNE
jgi:hypothetical protein